MDDLHFTISRKGPHRLHGCLNWKEMFRIEKDYLVIRLRDENKKLYGQVAIEFADVPGYEKSAWIFFLSVDPKYQNCGVGSVLLEKAEEYVLKEGIDDIFLHAQKEFEEKLIPYYEHRGYKKIKRDPDCNDEWIFMKQLS